MLLTRAKSGVWHWHRTAVYLLVVGTVAALAFYLYCYFEEVNKFSLPIPTAPLASSERSPHDYGKSSYNVSVSESPLKNWPNLSRLDCPKLFNADPKYIAQFKQKRVVLKEPRELDLDCAAVKSRWHFFKSPSSEGEADFPIAFARTVYMDYVFLEQMLAIEYQPQNTYCYSIDVKSNKKFKKRIRNLANCFPNVFVVGQEFDVQSNGKNVSRSHLECLWTLLKRSNTWKYAILLQNHDIPLKTNFEMTEILKVFNGANDVSARRVVAISVNKTQDWSFATLQLYKNVSKTKELLLRDGNDARIHHTKSLNLVALSRKAVDFVRNELTLDTFIDRLEHSDYGMDEVFWSTLNTNIPDLPGGFTWQCYWLKKKQTNNVGRFTVWRNSGSFSGGGCMTRKFRHQSCVFGSEDLAHLDDGLTHLYFNKMMPVFDYGGIDCWLWRLDQRRRVANSTAVNRGYYAGLAHVRYNRAKANGMLEQFEC